MLGRIKSRIRRVGSDESRNSSNSSRRGPSPTYALMDQAAYVTKLTDLASFDACVEACDALAASSSYAQSSSKRDPLTGMKDCSVLVSPDGDLLLVPQERQIPLETNDSETSKSETNGTNHAALETEKPAPSPPSPYAKFLATRQESDDYNSAVIMGYDLQNRGDHALNGFSAMGWSVAATSLSIRQSEQALRKMTSFMEELITSKKEHAARAAHACDHLRTISEDYGIAPPLPIPVSIRNGEKNGFRRKSSSGDSLASLSELEPLGSSWNSSRSAHESSLLMSINRVGPLSYRGGTIHAATVAFEQYQIMMSENDANRWRAASHGSLAAIRKAAEKVTERCYNRETSLKDMQRRANDIEERLLYCKAESKRRWQLVYAAEELVVKIMEENMLERSKERERQRVEQFRKDQEAHENDTNKAHLGATQAEVWDMIAAVANSMEDGSFTPLDLPQAPVKGPRDQAMQSSDQPTPMPVSTQSLNMQDSSIPFEPRAQIEQQCNLPSLRSSALAADEAIEDAAGSLLNVLSNLDTTRRSARVAAETCLLSASNSHAECLKALVRTERECLEERLQNLAELERCVEGMDVRADLDAYISNDKKDRGGSTWMGEDDDGGIASALAVLSSHVDGSMGHSSPNRMMVSGWDVEEQDEGDVTPEMLEKAVDDLFFDKEDLKILSDSACAQFDKTVSILCKVAEDTKHPCSRSRRSTICYALNSKRSSAQLHVQMQFDGISKVIYSLLSGCDQEAGSVANAKMCMMLSQSFFLVDDDKDEKESKTENESPSRSARSQRIYVKSKLTEHPLWADEEFWDQALFQCVTESLTHSGVMTNFERGSGSANRSEWTETRKLKWHDLTHSERCEAASQVHAVVFAQLGALAHSMIEFGCGLERSCSFVRRMSVRNQLPISQRTMLLQHLVGEEAASPTKATSATQ